MIDPMIKFSRLQVQHAGLSEAKKLVQKTVGARVAHKIRLMSAERDLSKYMIFDVGLVNYLLNGSNLLNNVISSSTWGIMLETFVGNELVALLPAREDLKYWKSGNVAELEFLLAAPKLAGIDVKSSLGNNKSLKSFAVIEEKASCLVKIGDVPLSVKNDYVAKLPNHGHEKKLPLIMLPHYLTPRLLDFLEMI